jgi:FkbM family methyltransferase
MEERPFNDVRRGLARRYPLLPYRGRVPWLNGRVEDIPQGQIVATRERIVVRVLPDGMYENVYFWGDYEPYHTKIFRRIVRRGDVVFDIGANFGWFTTLFAQWVGDTGHVHAFEPVPFIRAFADETVALNKLAPRVSLNPFGLGREPAELPIYTFAGLPHGHASHLNLGREDAVEHVCRIERLDDYCERRRPGPVRFMKVDVEGWEPDVFAGAERLLSGEDAPIIAFEINGDCLRRRSLRGSDVIEALRDVGYSEFFAFSIRTGVTRVEGETAEHANCLAAKPTRMDELAPALRTGRLLR